MGAAFVRVGGRNPRFNTPTIRAGWGSDHKASTGRSVQRKVSAVTQEGAADKPLNAKQEQFCREYLIDLNATQAAIRAGYSPRTAGSQAHDLLKKPEIARRLQVMQGQRAERATLDAQTVLEGLLIEARGEGPDTASSARTAAWKLVGQHLGMWKESKDDGKRSGLDDLVASMAALRSKREES